MKITKQDIDHNVVCLIKKNLEWAEVEDDPVWMHYYIGLVDGINQLAEALKEVIDARQTENEPIVYDVNDVVEQLKDSAVEFEIFGMANDYVELTHAIEITKKFDLLRNKKIERGKVK